MPLPWKTWRFHGKRVRNILHHLWFASKLAHLLSVGFPKQSLMYKFSLWMRAAALTWSWCYILQRFPWPQPPPLPKGSETGSSYILNVTIYTSNPKQQTNFPTPNCCRCFVSECFCSWVFHEVVRITNRNKMAWCCHSWLWYLTECLHYHMLDGS